MLLVLHSTPWPSDPSKVFLRNILRSWRVESGVGTSVNRAAQQGHWKFIFTPSVLQKVIMSFTLVASNFMMTAPQLSCCRWHLQRGNASPRIITHWSFVRRRSVRMDGEWVEWSMQAAGRWRCGCWDTCGRSWRAAKWKHYSYWGDGLRQGKPYINDITRNDREDKERTREEKRGRQHKTREDNNTTTQQHRRLKRYTDQTLQKKVMLWDF